MSNHLNYREGYCSGQHDVLTWLSVPNDPRDHPMVAIDERVQFRAAMVCLAANLAVAGIACHLWRTAQSNAIDWFVGKVVRWSPNVDGVAVPGCSLARAED